jgi:hypothetical protein
MLESLIAELTKEFKLDKTQVKKETSGNYRLSLANDYFVTLQEIPEGLLFKCEIAPLPGPPKEELFLEHALHANLFGHGTHDGVLGLTADESLVTFTRMADPSTNYRDFKLIVEDFFNDVDYWKEAALKGIPNKGR